MLLDEILALTNANFDSVDHLVGRIDADDWGRQSLCPAWTIRDVLGHLGGIEHVLTGWMPVSVDELLPFDRVPAFIESTRQLDDVAFARRYREIVEYRRADLDRLRSEDLERPSPTPIGPGTYGRFMEIRAFDYWIHERDMSIPLGLATMDGGAPGLRVIDEIRRSLGYIVGKLIGAPDKTSITFELSGAISTSLHVAVDGRAAVVDGLSEPTVVVRTDSTDFAMLAAGRVDPDELIAQGRLAWSGSTGSPEFALGERAAHNLRFTI